MLSIEYIAGFIDGEGCFSISKHKSNPRGTPSLTIANTNYDVLKAIEYTFSLWGLKTGFYADYQRPSRGCKVGYSLCVYEKQSLITLCEILNSHLTVKSEHASLIIEFLTLRLREGHKGRLHIEKEDAITKRIRELNKKGV